MALDCATTREVACRAVPPMLAEVGVRTEPRVHPVAEFDRMLRAKAVDLYLHGYATTFDSEMVFRDRYHSRAPYNATGYADPEVDRLVETIGTEFDAYVRDALIEQVWRKVNASEATLPDGRRLVVAVGERLRIHTLNGPLARTG